MSVLNKEKKMMMIVCVYQLRNIVFVDICDFGENQIKLMTNFTSSPAHPVLMV